VVERAFAYVAYARVLALVVDSRPLIKFYLFLFHFMGHYLPCAPCVCIHKCMYLCIHKCM